jgi:hypothetical protein
VGLRMWIRTFCHAEAKQLPYSRALLVLASLRVAAATFSRQRTPRARMSLNRASVGQMNQENKEEEIW